MGTMTKWPVQKLLIGLHKDTPIINNMTHTFDSNVSKHQYFRTLISLFAYCFFCNNTFFLHLTVIRCILYFQIAKAYDL